MKVWSSFGSEHSANLVMIGRFNEAGAAEEVKDIIAECQKVFGEPGSSDPNRYSDDAKALIRKHDLYSIGSADLEQFGYDFTVKLNGHELVITTDEIDVASLMKLLVLKGARVEIYSAHDYSDTGHGRNTKSPT